jgi:hypothetical protein
MAENDGTWPGLVDDGTPWPQSGSTPMLASAAVHEDDPSEQWFFLFHEHLLLTVQAVQHLHAAVLVKLP